MKKLVAILLSVVLLACLCACSNANSENPKADSESVVAENQEASSTTDEFVEANTNASKKETTSKPNKKETTSKAYIVEDSTTKSHIIDNDADNNPTAEVDNQHINAGDLL